MNIEQELERMIMKVEARTNGAPVQIFCSQDTLNQLCERSGMMYTNDRSTGESSGYVGRYMGIPVVVTPGVEPGKVYLASNQTTERPNMYGVDFSGDMNRFGGWWTSSPFSYPDNNWGTVTHTFNPHYYADPYSQAVYGHTQQHAPDKEQEEAVDIDEDSFLDILRGGGDDVHA